MPPSLENLLPYCTLPLKSAVRRPPSIAFADLLVFVRFKQMMIDYNGLINSRKKESMKKYDKT
jgi:hypothetical protein